MSDATTPRLKVSREGIALIKSFEGFRPRAVRSADGGWVIGYGHAASAREGLSVTEAEAELLLQYDLLHVVRALNEQAPGRLNQHQFDALASFGVSIGLERFLSSDVFQQLTEGRPEQAAHALLGWPIAPSPENRFRRRAAERALFNADPSMPVGLADVMTAPLPFPAQPEPDARSTAVAVLLGEHPLSAMSVAPFPAVESSVEPSSAALLRYAPYATGPVGPLPGFPAADDGPALPTAEHPGEEPPVAAGPGTAPGEAEDAVASVLRHEAEPVVGRRSDRGGAAPFLVIGAAGLTACGGAAAAFRLAIEQLSPMGETLVVAWALALIGVVCVSVASWNLYLRWGRPD